MQNIFNKTIADEIINRVNKLTPTTNNLWGKMNAAKMLAHCNVTYELVYDNIHPKPNPFKKFILKTFIKNIVVSENEYKKNGQTAPEFKIIEDKKFNEEKERLINYIYKTQQLGENYFDGKESHSFGILNKTEWNNMFYKHLNHHLNQFGV